MRYFVPAGYTSNGLRLFYEITEEQVECDNSSINFISSSTLEHAQSFFANSRGDGVVLFACETGYHPPSQAIYLIRGLPGSGKTTLAKRLTNVLYNAVMFANDDYFTSEDGVYTFDSGKIADACRACQLKTFDALREGKSVIIHNTFTRSWEAMPYALMSLMFNVKLHIIVCYGNFGNVHNVPVEVLDKMKSRFMVFDDEDLLTVLVA
jgi:hypothetical protein